MRREFKLDALIRQYKEIIFTTCGIILFTIGAPILILGSSNTGSNPFSLNDDSIAILEEVKIKGDNKVSVYITKEDKVESIDVEEYLIGVVSSEMLVSFNEEALKAQAVAARTYYFSKRGGKCPKAKGAEICDTVHCQVYVSKDQKIKQWGSKGKQNFEKIKNAVYETKGEVLTYKNELVSSPLFFSTSSGNTEDAKDVFGGNVPYLKSISSPGEEEAPKYKASISMKKYEVVKTLNEEFKNTKLTENNLENKIKIGKRSKSGGILELKIGDTTVKGTDFRMALGLYSTNFTYEVRGDEVIFNCLGYGHGVGMSQYGANAMGNDGKSYQDILTHYYSGVEVSKIKYIK